MDNAEDYNQGFFSHMYRVDDKLHIIEAEVFPSEKEAEQYAQEGANRRQDEEMKDIVTETKVW